MGVLSVAVLLIGMDVFRLTKRLNRFDTLTYTSVTTDNGWEVLSPDMRETRHREGKIRAERLLIEPYNFYISR